jgi:hypothetical protein
MKTQRYCILLSVAAATALRAGTLIADFNDLTAGDLNGQAGGTGFGPDVWTNNSAATPETFIDIIGGDLSAPAGTHYALAQSGTPQKVQNTNGTTSLETRVLQTPLTGTTIWFSFLINQPNASPGSNTGSRCKRGRTLENLRSTLENPGFRG